MATLPRDTTLTKRDEVLGEYRALGNVRRMVKIGDYGREVCDELFSGVEISTVRTDEQLAFLKGLEGVDVVIDDASPSYAFTRQALDFIFPQLKTGCLYFIEDWRPLEHPHRDNRFLGELAASLMKDMAAGGSVGNIKALPNMLKIRRR